jgi:hypothetical protein
MAGENKTLNYSQNRIKKIKKTLAAKVFLILNSVTS